MISESVFLFRDDPRVRTCVLEGGEVFGLRDMKKNGTTGTRRELACAPCPAGALRCICPTDRRDRQRIHLICNLGVSLAPLRGIASLETRLGST